MCVSVHVSGTYSKCFHMPPFFSFIFLRGKVVESASPLPQPSLPAALQGLQSQTEASLCGCQSKQNEKGVSSRLFIFFFLQFHNFLRLKHNRNMLKVRPNSYFDFTAFMELCLTLKLFSHVFFLIHFRDKQTSHKFLQIYR